MLAVNDRKLTGHDATLSVFPLVKLTITSRGAMSGDFRFVLGDEITGPISVRSTQMKISEEINKLPSIGSIVMLGSSYRPLDSLLFYALIDDSLQSNPENVVVVAGDVRSAIAVGDTAVVGTCSFIISHIKHDAFNVLDGAGLIYSLHYNESSEAALSKRLGYTTIAIDRQTGNGIDYSTSLSDDCNVPRDVAVEIQVGKAVFPKIPLPGLISFQSDTYLLESRQGSKCITINKDLPTDCLAVTIDGLVYDIDVLSGSCGSNGITLSSTYTGIPVTRGLPRLIVYPTKGMTAYTTKDLSVYLSAGDCIHINEDKLIVSTVYSSKLVLEGKITANAFGERVYKNGIGVEYAIVIKNHASNLNILQFIPCSNMRGLDMQLHIKRPLGHLPRTYILGSQPVVQIITLRETIPSSGDTQFNLTFDGFTTDMIPWPSNDGSIAAINIERALSRLPSLDGDVFVKAFAYSKTDFVFWIHFTGVSENVPLITSSSFNSLSCISSFQNYVRDGTRNSFFSPKHVVLKPNMKYFIRISATNSAGSSHFSEVRSVTLADLKVLPSPPRSVLVGHYYSFDQLYLTWSPPVSDGGSKIVKYLVEWSTDLSFNHTIPHYGSSVVEMQQEEQAILLSCLYQCHGTFTIQWGIHISNSISVEATASVVELEISKLFVLSTFDSIPVRVSMKRISGYSRKWLITFVGVQGDIGLLHVNDQFVYGGEMSAHEVTAGKENIYPGSFSYEVQTLSVHRSTYDFGSVKVEGSFVLSFEDRYTSSINVACSALEMQAYLGSLSSIEILDLKKIENEMQYGWVVTFMRSSREGIIGAGDIELISVSSSRLSDPFTSISVTRNFKGSNPALYKISSLFPGLVYHFRVSAYNAFGSGPPSQEVIAVPRGQPEPPPVAEVSVISGTELKVSWRPVEVNNGSPVEGYMVEWYSDKPSLEVQQLKTSATDSVYDVQMIKTMADDRGIVGFFTVAFNGSTTQHIAHNAEANGAGSLREYLSRLPNIGDVIVSRSMSKVFIENAMFTATQGRNILKLEKETDLSALCRPADIIFIGEEQHEIVKVSLFGIEVKNTYQGSNVTGIYIQKWAYGYEWMVTFVSNTGPQPLMSVHPSQNFGGKNAMIIVKKVKEGQHPLSGSFTLSYKGDKTWPLPYDCDGDSIKKGLEALTTIGKVDVSRFRNANGWNYFITFLSELGNLEEIVVNDSRLTGPNAKARIVTVNDGSLPPDYRFAIIPSASILHYNIESLVVGTSYFVRVRSKNTEGFGDFKYSKPSPFSPKMAPNPPLNVSVIVMSDARVKVVWQKPFYEGGCPVSSFVVQWCKSSSTSSNFSSYFQREVSVDKMHGDAESLCIDVHVDPYESNGYYCFRVYARNCFAFSSPTFSLPGCTKTYKRSPGAVPNLVAVASSSQSIKVTWGVSEPNRCNYGGDGGAAISRYELAWDTHSDFSTPFNSAILTPDTTAYTIGGRDVVTGVAFRALEAGLSYFVRVIAFNSIGPGEASEVFVHSLQDVIPGPPQIINTFHGNSSTSLGIVWSAPFFDGGSPISSYLIEYDKNTTFSNPEKLSVPVVREIQAVELLSDVVVEVQSVVVASDVENERQLVRTSVDGRDEVQTVTTTCDDVVAEVQTITTSIIEKDEVQVISFSRPDVDEIQEVRVQGDDIPGIQSVQVSVSRINEVQKLGIIIYNISTGGESACVGVAEGDPCEDVEKSISGSFTVSYDFDNCGGLGDANFCQAALSKYEPTIGIVSCNPSSVADPRIGGEHCVSNPVTLSFSSLEGDAGTLQKALNDLIDDNGKPFMTVFNVPGKKTAVTVKRTGKIKKKASCSSTDLQPASCMGSYEIEYLIMFDAYHSSGDVPPVTVVQSTIKIDTSSMWYKTKLCSSDLFPNGCKGPIVMSQSPAGLGNFYDGAEESTAIEVIKGNQPSGAIVLNYECESDVVRLKNGHMASLGGSTVVFTDADYVRDMKKGQWVRFSSGSLDAYREILFTDTHNATVTFTSPVNSFSHFTDVEYGDYFSDFGGEHGNSGVSALCQESRIHQTLPIDVSEPLESLSTSDWAVNQIGTIAW